jgi:hypothetical protein
MNKRLLAIVIVILLNLAGGLPRALAQSNEIRGTVTDETGAVIVAATVTLDDGNGHKQTTRTDEGGHYRFVGVQSGNYSLAVSSEGFDQFSQQVAIPSPRPEPVNITLKVSIKEQMEVRTDTSGISTEPDMNISSITLSGSDLEALPDDPDELLDTLRQMAGTTGAPNDTSLYVDGFLEGGRLPPKEAIQMIRINNNPFSAEYQEHGVGRIEIITKPGASQFHGGFRFNFDDSALNARNPFQPVKIPSQVRAYNAFFTGPVIKNRWGFFFNFERRDSDNNAIVSATILDPATLQPVPFATTILTPARLMSFDVRSDVLLSKLHSLRLWFRRTTNDLANQGVGGFSLPEQGATSRSIDDTFRIAFTTMASEHLVNEARMELSQRGTTAHANSSAPAISVLQAFTSGGNQGQVFSDNTNRNLQFTDDVTYTLNRHTIKFGTRVVSAQLLNRNESNFGGTFTFGTDVERDSNGSPILDAHGQPIPIPAIDAYRNTLMGLPGYRPSQFSIQLGDPFVGFSQWNFSWYAMDDWKLSPRLTLSGGLREELQTHLQDKINLAPRMSIAWAPDKNRKSTIRAGAGIFYAGLSSGITADAIRLDGQHQESIVIPRPDFFPNIPASFAGIDPRFTTIRIKAPDLNDPYSIISSVEYDRALPKNLVASIGYSYQKGVHLLRTRDLNAPIPGSGVLPFPGQGPILDYESTGESVRQDLRLSVRANLGRRLNLFGNYILASTHANTDGAGTAPANSYDLSTEWGRASFDQRHHVFVGGTIALPRGFRISPLIQIASGRPFNITTGRDNNLDSIFTDRPAFATISEPGAVITPFGIFNPNPLPGDQIIPRNFGNGPGMVLASLNFSKTFGFGPAPQRTGLQVQNPGGGNGGGRMRGAGGGGGGRGGGGGGFLGAGPGGFGGGPTSASDAHRYTVTFNVNFTNILNHTNLGPYNGVLTSPLFGLASSALQPRRIELAMRFNF